jgi:hypothetical protein
MTTGLEDEILGVVLDNQKTLDVILRDLDLLKQHLAGLSDRIDDIEKLIRHRP